MRVLRSWQLMAVLAVVAFATAGWMAVAAAGEPGVPTTAGAFGEAEEPVSVVGPIAPRWGPRQPGSVFTIDRYVRPPWGSDGSGDPVGPGPDGGTIHDDDGTGVGSRSAGDPGTGDAAVDGREDDTDRRRADDEPDPVAVVIPELGVDAATIPLGLDDTGAVEVPSDADQAGWWHGGPEPGEPGASVLLGHVDSWEGPAVFYGLHTLGLGDEVLVRRADGSTLTFAVTGGGLYHKDHFPTDRVYTPDTDEPVLRLVTCGGRFDGETRSYDSNYVLYAELVSRSGPAVPSGLS